LEVQRRIEDDDEDFLLASGILIRNIRVSLA
jgi:hypothetical protein